MIFMTEVDRSEEAPARYEYWERRVEEETAKSFIDPQFTEYGKEMRSAELREALVGRAEWRQRLPPGYKVKSNRVA